ncbi:MAG TPA: glutathione S-transferase N-terminal domain-containing protein [Candidatus Binatia bacterium]|jgi:glutathione S-transferase
MIELHHNDMSVCAQKVRFAPAEKKLKWEGHPLNLRAADQQRPEYLKLTPNAVVPTLVDDGTVIIESTVINEYLDDADPEIDPTDIGGRRATFSAALTGAAERGSDVRITLSFEFWALFDGPRLDRPAR